MVREHRAEAKNVEVLHTAVEAFRRREIGYRDILEDLPAAIFTTDTAGRITYFNKACIGFSGRTPVLGEDRWCVSWKLYTTSGDPLPHEQGPTAVALRELRHIHGAEAVAQRPDGTLIDFAAFPTPIFDAAGECLGIVCMLVDVSQQKQAHDRLELLAREIDHRSNNLLAVVQSLIRLTKAESVDDYKATLEGRLMAIARANSLIATGRWKNVNLKSLVEEELGAFRSQVTISGESIELEPTVAQNLAMVVHELSTNSIKHGSLSVAGGKVRVAWSHRDDDLNFTWEESCGPPTEEPIQTNTGSAVIAASVRQLAGHISREWHPEGLRLSLSVKMRRPKE